MYWSECVPDARKWCISPWCSKRGSSRPRDRRLQTAIADIHDKGSTNLTSGWMLGRDEVANAPADVPRKLLLLTDDPLNQGIIETPRVRQIVSSGLEKELIRASGLGFAKWVNVSVAWEQR